LQQLRVTAGDLASTPLLADADSRRLERLAKGSRELRLASTEQLCSHGQEARHAFFLQSGQVKLYRLSEAGDEKVLDVLPTSHSLVDRSIFLQRTGTYPYTVEALTPARVLALDLDGLYEVVCGSARCCIELNRLLAQHIERLLDEVHALTLQDVELRVANYLNRFVRHADGPQTIELPMPKHLLASRLSMTPETLSRVFRRFKEAGTLTVERRHVRIHDAAELRRCAEMGICKGARTPSAQRRRA